MLSKIQAFENVFLMKCSTCADRPLAELRVGLPFAQPENKAWQQLN